ncbi:hypothetical protein Tco_1063081 [Tanacetum coccineum]
MITMAGPITNDYISATRKSFISNDNDGKMIQKNFIEIEGTFLVKIRDNAFKGINGENVFKHINNFLEVVEPLKVKGVSHDRFRLSLPYLTLRCQEEAEDDDDPDEIDNIPEIFKIDDDLFNFDTPLCKEFEEFNYLLKIEPDLFTYDVKEFKTYDEYEQQLKNHDTQDLNEQWSDNDVPYQLCDHICEPCRFKNGITKWPTCSSDIDGYCNGGELLGMVRVRRMTYFQDHKWYDNLIDECLKDETLMHNARIEGSWGDATPDVMKFCTWLINSFENFHELDYDDDHPRGPYANAEPKRTYDLYHDINCISEITYETNNIGNIHEGQRHMENPTHEPSTCKIRRFEMMKYSFEDDEEYVAIKELEHINHSETNMDARYAYRELFRKIDDGWLVTRAMDE